MKILVLYESLWICKEVFLELVIFGEERSGNRFFALKSFQAGRYVDLGASCWLGLKTQMISDRAQKPSDQSRPG